MKSACKILSLALALVFCIRCFAACGGGAGDKTIIIGGSGPLTGLLLMRSTLQAATMATPSSCR